MAMLQREVCRASVQWWVREKDAGVWKDGPLVKEKCVCDELVSYYLAHADRPFGLTSMPCLRSELIGLAQPMAEVGLKRKDQMERCH